MHRLLKSRIRGLNGELDVFSKKICDCSPADAERFSRLLSEEMERLDFDRVTCDAAGNLIGTVKGYQDKGALIVISHLDIPSWEDRKKEFPSGEGMLKFKAGIISGIYAGALMKRSLLPLSGDLVVCCVPRLECCDFGIRYLFDNYLKSEVKKIKGVVLAEPTDFNVFLGHKGRMEYEITVRGKSCGSFFDSRGVNMLGTMFPLISELEKVSRQMPRNSYLGHSNLRIKDVRYSGYRQEDGLDEFRIIVDREFIPEENQNDILDRAKSIAADVYRKEPEVTVSTALSMEKVKTYKGLEIVSEKDFKPWTMDSYRPFALDSLGCLTENGFKSSFGYWKKITTEGSYTYAKLGIPTVGFGAGSEDDMGSGSEQLVISKLPDAVYGLGLIIHRNIGLPSFGWSSDEI